MRMTGLNFEAIPELNVPLRFYLTAPVFAILASILLVGQGSDIWLSRWLPASLAITHLLAIGVMGMIMIGSLFQVMPVLCGAPINIGKVPLLLMQTGLVVGTLTLCAGFLGWIPFTASFVLLALSLGYFIISLLSILFRKAGGQQTRTPMLLAVLSLAALLIAGLLLLSGYLWGIQPASGKSLTNFHASIGVFGWVLLLMMAVSFQVIPMFHVTPVFPHYWRIGLVTASVSGLIAMIIATFSGSTLYYVAVFNALVGILYASISLNRLKQRKRKLPDVVISYWQFGFACLISGCILIITIPFLPLGIQVKVEVLLALIIGFGFIIGVMQGMLLKIVPFLISLHLQPIAMQKPTAMMLLPDHYSLITRQQGKVQFRLYLAVLASIVLSFLVPEITVMIGLLLAINWMSIGYNLAKAFYLFNNVRRKMLDM